MWRGPLACHARFIGAFFGEADSFYINLSEKCFEESEHGTIVTELAAMKNLAGSAITSSRIP